MSYSCNDNQNYFVEEGRTTSRVLAPPGGKTSISLGSDEPEPAVKRPSPPPPQEATVAKKDVVNKVVQSSQPPEPASAPVSANAFASGANMNGAQVMTGRPTSRVLAPPGGHTSFTLG